MSKLIKVGILISGKLSNTVKRSTDAAVKNQGRVGSAISKVNKQLGQAKEARKYGRLLNDLKKKQRGLGHSSERLDRGIEEVERRYNEARRAASRYGSEIGDVERQTRRLGDTQKKQSAGLSKGQIGAAIGAAGGAALTASVIGAGNREEDGIYLRTVINARDEDGDGEVDDAEKDAAVGRTRVGARAFARSSLADEKEIVEVEYALNSAGLEEDVSRAGARMVHKVAKITKGQSGQVGEIIGTTFNNLGNQMVGTAEEKIERIGNILTKTQFKFQIRDFGQLGASMEYGLATAASYKIGLEQTAASIGFLNSAGFQGSRAGTTFAAMMRNMTKAGDELGFSMVRGADGSLDFMSTMAALGESLEGLETDEKADLIGKIFGDEGKGGVIAMLNNLESLKRGYEDVNEAAKSDLVNEEYERFLKSSLGTWRRIRQNIGQTGTSIGSDLLPVLNVVGEAFANVMGFVAWGVENVPGLGFAIGLVATVVVGTAIAMGVATTATWAWNAALRVTTNRRIIGFVGMLTKSLWGFALRAAPAAVVGIRAIGAALLLNPIGLAITAIAVGAFLLIKFWKPISGFFKRVFAGMKAPAVATWNFFKTLFKWSPLGLLTRGMGGGLRWLGKAFGGPRRLAGASWSGIKTVLAWSPTRLLKRGFGVPLNWLSKKFGDPKKAVGAAWTGIKTVMAWSPLGLAKKAWTGLPKIYGGVMDLSGDVISAGAKKITEPLLAPLRLVEKLWNKIRGVKKDAAGVKVGDTATQTRHTAVNDNFTREETVQIGETVNTTRTNEINERRDNEESRYVGEVTHRAHNTVLNESLTRDEHVQIGEATHKLHNAVLNESLTRDEHVQIGEAINREHNSVVNDAQSREEVRRIGETINVVKEDVERHEVNLQTNEAVNTTRNNEIGETVNTARNTVINDTQSREEMVQVGEAVNRVTNDVENNETTRRVGEIVNTTRNVIINDTQNRVSTVRVGSAVNDNSGNEANDNAPPVQPGKVYASLNGGGASAPATARAPLQAPRVATAPATAPSTTTHVREGDTFIFHGVLDAEDAVRKLEPALKRREQENREADLHD